MSKTMESEIRQQPELLQANSARYESEFDGLRRRPLPPMVVIAARGSSDNAAHYLRYLIEICLGVPVCLAAPSVVTVKEASIHFPPGSWAIGISQSGSAPDVCEYLVAARCNGCTTIGITNGEDSRLAKVSDMCLQLGAGVEKAVPATKTYTSTLLACYQLVRAVIPGLPDPATSLPTEVWVQQTCQSSLAQVAALVDGAPTFALGRMYSYSTALETSLKLMECALVACKGYSSADFHHGPKSLADASATVIDFTRTSKTELGQPVRYIVPPSVPESVDEVLWPLWDTVFGQWLALHAATSKGIDPDSPQFLRKVTSTL